MRFLIDFQCVQSGSRNRGIGRYACNLLDALLPAAGAAGHEIHLLLNSAFPHTIPDIQRRYPKLQAARQIHIFHGLTHAGIHDQNGPWRKAASELLRDFSITCLSPDLVFCPSIFEGDSEPFTLGPQVLSQIPTIATQHDLIPAQMPEVYFDANPDFRAFYRTKMENIRSFAALIAVSEATRREALELLDYPAEHVHVILEDADPQFVAPDRMSLNDMEGLRARYGLTRPYLLYVGSGEPRKNLTGLIKAYGALPQRLINRHDLVIVGQLTKEEIDSVHRLAKELALDMGHVRLLGQTSDSDLPGLYGLAALFVMPSLREGFGLPALEAMRCGTVTLGSNRTSLPEVIGTSDALFDPEDILGMAALIARSLTDQKFRNNIQIRQLHHTTRFSWTKAARETLAIMERYSRDSSPVSGWRAEQDRLDAMEGNVIAALQALVPPHAGLRDHDQTELARALVKTRLAVEDALRPKNLPQTPLAWRLEGPFDSDYSLASVNRATARALSRCGVDVALFSAEGPGPFEPDAEFLKAHPDLAALHATAQGMLAETAHVLSRNMFPPRVCDMRAPLNLLHGYAWEETGLPQAFTRDMNAHLQGLLVTTSHVKKLFEDAGIGLPIYVVGNGVDHLDVVAEPLPFTLPPAAFTCLHVSSCFPRKGIDVLLNGFAEAFDKGDDVQLVIKTFPNPHNDITTQVHALRTAYPDLPPITVTQDPLTPGQMHSLYAAADILIAPSRAEGYCLPVAEAVLAGTPVLTTNWGGQRVFSGNPLVHFIDYTFAPAQSHLGAWDSIWAEPSQADMVAQLRMIRSAPKPNQETRHAATRQILKDHTWNLVAERSVQAARNIAAQIPTPPPTVAWVSSYNTRCGIATYSEHLIKAFPDQVTVLASHTQDRIIPDSAEIKRCWQQDGSDTLAQLQNEIHVLDPRVLVIQFNYGFFSFPALAALILRAKADGRQVVMMLHATDDEAVPSERHLARIRPALEACDRLLVHSHHDLNHLKAMGLIDNVALFPHGVPYVSTAPRPAMTAERPVVLGTYGFFLPPKGLDTLIDAVALMRQAGAHVALEMVNAQYPVDDSRRAIAAAREQITRLGLDQHVALETRFLEDADSFRRLSRADALVFPYQKTAESASGAIRQALALDRPVIATPLRIFDDVAPLITRLSGTTAQAIAAGLHPIIDALRDPAKAPDAAAQLATTRATVASWRESHAYAEVGPRLWRQICGLCDKPTGK